MTQITLEKLQEKYKNIETQFNGLTQIIDANQKALETATDEYNKAVSKIKENINNARNEQLFLQGAANSVTTLMKDLEGIEVDTSVPQEMETAAEVAETLVETAAEVAPTETQA